MNISKTHKAFTLYKLPVLHVLVLSLIYLLSVLGLFLYLQEDVDIVNQLLAIGMFLGSTIIAYIPCVGLLMMIFYRYRITVFTGRNIVFTVCLTLIQIALFALLGAIVFPVIDRNPANYFLLMLLQPFLPLVFMVILPLGLWYVVKLFYQHLDTYQGELPTNRIYWRFSNMFSIFAFLVAIVSLVSPLLFLVEFYIAPMWQFSGVEYLLFLMIIPMAVSLFIIVFSKSIALNQLHIRAAFTAARELVFWGILFSYLFMYVLAEYSYQLEGMSQSVMIFLGILGLLAITVFTYWVVKRRFSNI